MKLLALTLIFGITVSASAGTKNKVIKEKTATAKNAEKPKNTTNKTKNKNPQLGKDIKKIKKRK